MRLQRAAFIYFLLYIVGAGLWELFKISAGCPCGWIADCIDCGIIGGIFESYALWGIVAVVLASPVVVLVLVVKYFIRLRKNKN